MDTEDHVQISILSKVKLISTEQGLAPASCPSVPASNDETKKGKTTCRYKTRVYTIPSRQQEVMRESIVTAAPNISRAKVAHAIGHRTKPMQSQTHALTIRSAPHGAFLAGIPNLSRCPPAILSERSCSYPPTKSCGCCENTAQEMHAPPRGSAYFVSLHDIASSVNDPRLPPVLAIVPISVSRSWPFSSCKSGGNSCCIHDHRTSLFRPEVMLASVKCTTAHRMLQYR